MHWNTITPTMRAILNNFSNSQIANEFYLAGGTSLALQIGHRLSIDLDFFSASQADISMLKDKLSQALSQHSPVLADTSWGNLVFLAENVRIGFYGYSYALVDSLLTIEKIKLASLADIGLMKMDALLARASRKDFYDLFFICKQIPMRQLFELSIKKYPAIRDFEAQVVRHMVYFERAEQESPVPTFEKIEWNTIKEWFRKQAIEIGNSWL